MAETETRLYVEAFLKAEGLQYVFDEQPAGTGPDVVLKSPAGELGLEVTRVHRPKEPGRIPRQQMEGIRDTLMERAKQEWDAQRLPPLEVHCHYNYHHTPFVKDVPALARQLVDLVRHSMPPIGSSVHLGRDEDTPVPLPPALHSMSVVRLKGHDRSYWFDGDAEWGSDLNAGLVQERIDAKNRTFKRYHRPDRETWLLIVMDSRRFSGMMKVSDEAAGHEYASEFARTYLLDLLYNRNWRLQTMRPTPGLAL